MVNRVFAIVSHDFILKIRQKVNHVESSNVHKLHVLWET